MKGVTICGAETIAFGRPPQETATRLGAQELRYTANLDITSFVRMIAKMGYGLAVGIQGVFPRDESPVLPFILGITDDGSTWVGSERYSIKVEEKRPLHAFELININGFANGKEETILVVRVKLFASSGATGYEVVVRRYSRAETIERVN